MVRPVPIVQETEWFPPSVLMLLETDKEVSLLTATNPIPILRSSNAYSIRILTEPCAQVPHTNVPPPNEMHLDQASNLNNISEEV
jgi:hypothetical protein